MISSTATKDKYFVCKKPPKVGGFNYIQIGDVVTIDCHLQNGIVGIIKENDSRVYYYPRDCIAKCLGERRKRNDHRGKNQRY